NISMQMGGTACIRAGGLSTRVTLTDLTTSLQRGLAIGPSLKHRLVAPLELRALLQCFGMFIWFSPVLRLSQRKQMRVFWWKHECLHEFQTFVGQSPPDHGWPVLSGEITKIVWIDDS